jgi:membrane protease YdiL (CAAX protease family)
LIFALGLLIGTARVRSGSIVVPLAMHSMLNLGSLIEAGIMINAQSM